MQHPIISAAASPIRKRDDGTTTRQASLPLSRATAVATPCCPHPAARIAECSKELPLSCCSTRRTPPSCAVHTQPSLLLLPLRLPLGRVLCPGQQSSASRHRGRSSYLRALLQACLDRPLQWRPRRLADATMMERHAGYVSPSPPQLSGWCSHAPARAWFTKSASPGGSCINAGNGERVWARGTRGGGGCSEGLSRARALRHCGIRRGLLMHRRGCPGAEPRGHLWAAHRYGGGFKRAHVAIRSCEPIQAPQLGHAHSGSTWWHKRAPAGTQKPFACRQPCPCTPRRPPPRVQLQPCIAASSAASPPRVCVHVCNAVLFRPRCSFHARPNVASSACARTQGGEGMPLLLQGAP